MIRDICCKRIDREMQRISKGVTKDIASSKQAHELAYTLPTPCLHLAYTLGTPWVEHGCAVMRSLCLCKTKTSFLSQKNKLFYCGKWHTLGSKVAYYRNQNNLFCCGANMALILKPLFLLVLMMVLGGNKAWGQTDYSGTYYIGSNGFVVDNSTANYYLCPTVEYYYCDLLNNTYTDQNNGNAFLTTYKCRGTNGYDSSNAIWIIEKHPTQNYYYIKHASDNKYLTYNTAFFSNTGRVRVHLEDYSSDKDDYALFAIEYVLSKDSYDIISKYADDNATYSDKDGPRKYLNVNKGNKQSLKGDGDAFDNISTGGIIGLWTKGSVSDDNGKWYLEIPAPTCNLNDENKVELSALGDADIYYTTDGTDPIVPAEGEEPIGSTLKYSTVIPLVNSQIMVKAIATNKDHHIVSSSIVTYVYTQDITWTETSFEYNGSPQVPTVTSVKVGEDEVSVTEYDFSCTDNTNAGTATLTLTDKVAGNNYIVSGSTTFEISKKVATLDWDDTDLTYTGSALNPTANVSNLVEGDECTVTVSGGQTNVGNYTATATVLSNTNYDLPEATTQTFTISPKSLGDGTSIADGIDVAITKSGDNYVLAVKYGELSLTEGEGQDFTETAVGQEVTITAVTGEGKNYTGSGIVVTIDSEDIDKSEANEYLATYKSSRDLATPIGITAYVVSAINVDAGTVTVTQVDYIPNGVPVLLSADATFSGFSIKAITPETEFSGTNLLQRAEGTENVDLAQVYVYYQGEFVLTMEGTLSEGKFYLDNPGYSTGAPSMAPLRIVKGNHTTEMKGIREHHIKSDIWYSLDGRLLTGRPTEKGLYMNNHHKVVVK